MTVPVVWSAQKDGRGHYNCTTFLNRMFDAYGCQHIAGDVPNPTKGIEGAVYIVHGGRQQGSIDRINTDLDELKWAVVIVLGDEECVTPVEEIVHPNCVIWVQEPIPGRHDKIPNVKRYLLDGYTPKTLDYEDLALKRRKERDLDWFFAGQVTHQRRWQCVEALERMDWGGIEIRTRGYCQGVSIGEYHSLLSRSLIVPCPSGPFSPDAARPWEALCMGAVPILDDLSPTRPERGFWKLVLGEHPLPVIEDWRTLPQRIEEIKSDWDAISDRCQKWWSLYQYNFDYWLRQDIVYLCKT